MDDLRLPNNIIRLRHERKITQEELADFLGVTKASVSKWENAQSVPDILLLLQLAAFFDITIDELIGYDPQLTREQIRRFYTELSEDFAKQPFHETLDKIQALAHRYYSCYPFLLQLCVLYWNHYMLAETEEEQEQILKEAVSWCDHILETCGDVGVCGDALAVKAGLSLQLGNAGETIEMLEPASDPVRFSGQNGTLLVRAYQMAGEQEKARRYIQAREYLDMLNLVGDAVMTLALYQDDLKRCQKTVRRIRAVMEQYRLEQLHPNVAAQFHYQTAVMYAANKETEDALEALGLFENCIGRLLDAEKIVLHGDEYFDRVDEWIENLPLGAIAPRSREFVSQNVRAAFAHPVFESMRERPEFQKLIQRYKGGEDNA